MAIPIFDAFTTLDAVGPYEVLQRLPGAEALAVQVPVDDVLKTLRPRNGMERAAAIGLANGVPGVAASLELLQRIACSAFKSAGVHHHPPPGTSLRTPCMGSDATPSWRRGGDSLNRFP